MTDFQSIRERVLTQLGWDRASLPSVSSGEMPVAQLSNDLKVIDYLREAVPISTELSHVVDLLEQAAGSVNHPALVESLCKTAARIR